MISAATARTEPSAATDEWFTRSKLLLLMAVFVIVAFPSVVIGTDSFFYRDMGQFGYPLAHFHRDAFWRGEFPLWNPFNSCGLPFFAQWNTLVLYPGSLTYLLLPLPWSMNLFVLGHLFLAAAGMYSLAFRWTNTRFAASVAGLAFAWNGLTLHALMWPNNMAALAWMPWVVLTIERAWNEGGRRIFIAGLAGAMQMLGAGPEIILLTWLIVGLLWMREVLRGRGAAVSGSARMQPLRVQLFLRVALCGVIVFVLCAVQLLPFLDLLRHSNRDASFGGTAWAMPIWGWANFLVPLFGCTPSMIGVYSQDAQQWTSSYYMGIGTIALALLALPARDSRMKWIAAIAATGLVLALGEDAHVYATLKKILPLFGFIRFPIKYVVLAVFALPLLAAFGVARLQGAVADVERPRLSIVSVGCALLGLASLIVAFAWLAPVSRASPATATESGVTRIIFLLLILGALMWLSRPISPSRQRLVKFAVLFLMALDVLTHMPQQNPAVSNAAYGPVPFDMSRVPKLGESRAMISPPMQHLLQGLSTSNSLNLYLGHRRILLSDCNLIDRVPKVNGFFSLYLREADEVNRRLYRTTNYDLPLLDFLGVSQLSDDHIFVEWHTRSNAMPWVTAGQAPIIATPQETLDAIFSSRFDPRAVVYVPGDSRPQLVGVRSNECRVTSAEVRADSVFARVTASGASLVLIAQAYDRHWKAFIDGQPVPLLKANYAYQALIVPAGQHEVELHYQDSLFRVGGIISAMALVACGAGVLRRGSIRPVN